MMAHTAVVARNNWWGSADKKVIAAAVRDGSDRPGMGMVDSRYPLLKAVNAKPQSAIIRRKG